MSKLFNYVSTESIDVDDTFNEEMTEWFNERAAVSTENFNEITRTISALESVLDICDHVKDKNNISTEEYNIINIALENMVADTDYRPKHLMPGVERWTENVSLEEVTEAVERNVESISSRFSNLIRVLTDSLDLISGFIGREETTIKNLKKEVSSSNIKNATIEIKDSKYLRYGDDNNQVTTGAEYSSVFKTDMGKLNGVLKVVSKFQRDSLFISWKTLVKVLSDKKLTENYKLVYDLVTSIRNELGMKKVSSSSGFFSPDMETFLSEHLLGMMTVSVRLPEEKPTSNPSVEYIKKVASHINVTTNRDNIFNSSNSSGLFDITGIDKKNLMELLDTSEETIKAYKPFLKVANIIANKGSTLIINSFAREMITNKISLLRLLLSNYRLMLAISTIDYAISTQIFAHARGNIKEAIKFTKEALEQSESE